MEENLYLVQGTITLPVSMKIKGGNEEEAMKKVTKLLNSLNILIDKLDLQTYNGLHTVTVHDVELEWENVEESDEFEINNKKEPLEMK